MSHRFGKAVAIWIVFCLTVLGLSSLVPSSSATTFQNVNNADYFYTNGVSFGAAPFFTREALSPIVVNTAAGITRVDVQLIVQANMGGNDASDIDVYVRHPDGTEQQLVWSSPLPQGPTVQGTFNDITKFNGKLSSGTWNLRARDNTNNGNWNAIGGFIDSWTLTVHYNEPSLTLNAPANPGQTLRGNYQVIASVVGAGIDHVQLFVDGSYVSELALSGGNYVYTINTARHLDGDHTLSVTVMDWQNRTDTKSVPVQFDNFLPVLNFTQMVNNSFVRGKQQLLVAGSNGEARMKVNLTLAGPDARLDAQMATLGNNYFGYDWDTAAFADGSYNLSALTVDSSGNSASIGPFVINVDNTPPALAIASPTSGMYVSGLVNFDLTGSNDANPLYTQYRVDGGGWAPAPPSWNTGYQLDTSVLSDGAHRFHARAADAAGWTAEGYVDVAVNNAEPVLAIVAPSEGDFVQGTVTARARASSSLPISQVTFNVDGVQRQAGFSSASGYHELQIDTAQLGDGMHNLSASAQDASGKSVAVAGLSCYVDNHAPLLGVTGPLDNAIVSGTVGLEITVSDLYLKDVGWWLDQQPSRPMEPGNGTWVANLSTSGLPEGPHAVGFFVTDLAGHRTAAGLTVIVDNSQPGVELVNPAAGEFLSGTALFQVKAWDARFVSSATLHLSPGLPARTLALNAQSGYYELALDTLALADGNYSAWAQVTDTSGNLNSTPLLDFKVDNNPPQLAIAYPTEGLLVTGRDGSKLVGATASDAFLNKVAYSLDGNQWSDLSVPFTGAALADGAHAITVRAVDQMGRSTEQTVDFIYDGTLPVLIVASPTSGLHVAGVLKLGVSASDKLGIARVWAQPDASTKAEGESMAYNPASGMFEAQFDTAGWQGGDHTVNINVTVWDNSGYFTSAAVGVFADNSAPLIAKMLPGGSKEGRVEFRFSVSDGSAVKSVLFRRDGGAWNEMIRNDAKDYYYTTWSTGLDDNGVHTYEVRAVDALGNGGTASYTVSIENKDYRWVVAAVLVLLIIVAAACVWLAGRRKKRQESLENPPETAYEPAQPLPPQPPSGLPAPTPPSRPDYEEEEEVKKEETAIPRALFPPPAAARQEPGKMPAMPSMPPEERSPPPSQPSKETGQQRKMTTEELDRLVNGFTK